LKIERLKSNKEISHLFSTGKFLYTDNLKCGYTIFNKKEESVVKIAVSVPKKLFKLAVNRNKIKRQLRESYRLSNNIIKDIIQQQEISMNIMIIYNTKEKLNYHTIDSEVKIILNKIAVNIKETTI